MTEGPTSPLSSANRGPTLEAGLAGAGGGAGLIAIVQNLLPDGSPLIFIVPTVSVVISGLWIRMRPNVVSFLKVVGTRWEISRAIKSLEKQLRRNQLSGSERNEVKEEIRQLGAIRRQLISMRARALARQVLRDNDDGSDGEN